MRGSIAAGVTLAVLNVLDAFFTAEGISKFGVELEMNPFMRFLIESYGTWCLYAFKGFFITLLFYLLWKAPEEKMRRFVTPALWFMVGAYSVVVMYGAILWKAT